jgi:hypothetical protein
MKNEPLSESIVQSWHTDSQREVLILDSIVEGIKTFFDVSTKTQLHINQKGKTAIGC